MNKTVVFIHHERTVLRDLDNLVNDQAYKSMFFREGSEAYKYIMDHSVHMVIVNREKTDLPSEVLLNDIKKIKPEITRIMLCDITEVKSLTRCIENGLIKQVITKPWQDSDIKKQMNSLLSLESDLMESGTLCEMLELEDLPALPELYQSLMQLMSSNSDIDQVGELIAKDQSIALKILGLANSAFYGRKTGNINQAIMGIGLNNVKNIVLANSVFTESNDHLDLLWKHGVNSNRLLLAIYKDILKKKMPTLYGSVGLLHDIGRVVMYFLARDQYDEILKEAIEGEYDYIHLEEARLSMTHQQLGAYLLSIWELPYVYIEAAMYHHYPLSDKIVNKELVAVLHLANYYSLNKMTPTGTHNHLEEGVFDYLSIDREHVEMIVKELMEGS